jgi:hypothetical protein
VLREQKILSFVYTLIRSLSVQYYFMPQGLFWAVKISCCYKTQEVHTLFLASLAQIIPSWLGSVLLPNYLFTTPKLPVPIKFCAHLFHSYLSAHSTVLFALDGIMWNAIIVVISVTILVTCFVCIYMFSVPIPTYILGPSNPQEAALYSDISGCEVCPNVSYLGKAYYLS